MASGYRRNRLVTVTPDDCCRAPVLACRDFPEPPACRHTARGFPDGSENAIQDRPYGLARRFFRGLVAVCCHGLFSGTLPLKTRSGGAGTYRGRSVLPVQRSRAPERRVRRRKRSGDPSLWTWSVNPGTSVWLSRVFPRDPHSDQDVSSCSTYIGKMCRVGWFYHAVQRLNRVNGKDINAGTVRRIRKNYSGICRLAQYPCPHFS
jgi:hypothetical protein